MNTVYVYKINNHLVLTGDTKKIRKELKEYNARWQPDPFNMWLIPDTKLKSFLKNKNISALVTVIPLKYKKKQENKILKEKTLIPKKETMKEKTLRLKKEKEIVMEKEIIEKDVKKYVGLNMLDLLPQETINEVIKILDDARSITSLLTSTKKLSEYAILYQKDIRNQGIERELKHVNNTKRDYYKSKILDLKIGDRVFYKNQNYKILTAVGNKGGTMVHVDVFGGVIGTQLKFSIIKVKFGHNDNNYYWGIPLPNNKAYNKNNYKFIRSGVLLFDNGPEININLCRSS